MDPQQAAAAKAHLSILNNRLEKLRSEFCNAVKDDSDADKELETVKEKLENVKLDFAKKFEDLNVRHQADLLDHEKQITLAKDVLEKRREERNALLGYLRDMKMCEVPCKEFRDFDWASMKKMLTPKPRESRIKQQSKLRELSGLCEEAQASLNKLSEFFSSTGDVRDQVSKKLDQTKGFIKIWEETLESQKQKIVKLRTESERLHLLIKQCAMNDEPMSEYVTENVRAKCQSFLKSSSTEELLGGLTKYKERQERMIRLLKHRVNKLTYETNHLLVARDETVDQTRFYNSMIQSSRTF